MTGTMSPALAPGDIVKIIPVSETLLKRGDIVAYKLTHDKVFQDREFINRIVALPGETVEIRQEILRGVIVMRLIIDGAEMPVKNLNRNFIPARESGDSKKYRMFTEDLLGIEHTVLFEIFPFAYPPPKTFWTLGADEYFILGDNRANSYDSKDFGPVNRMQITHIVDMPVH